MQQTIEGINMSVSVVSLWEVGIIFGIICAIGYFLWSKGKQSVSPRR